MIFNSLLAYAAFPFVGKCSNVVAQMLFVLIDDAKLRRFLAHSKLFRSFFIKSYGQEN